MIKYQYIDFYFFTKPWIELVRVEFFWNMKIFNKIQLSEKFELNLKFIFY